MTLIQIFFFLVWDPVENQSQQESGPDELEPKLPPGRVLRGQSRRGAGEEQHLDGEQCIYNTGDCKRLSKWCDSYI